MAVTSGKKQHYSKQRKEYEAYLKAKELTAKELKEKQPSEIK